MATDAKTVTTNGQERLASLLPEEGILRLLARRREQLDQHYTFFIEVGGEEALHDLRVSVRRLRSMLRNYRDVIEIDEQLVDVLRTIQQQSNHARDLEVFIAQLQYYCPDQIQHIEPLQQQLDAAYQQLHHELPQLWTVLLPLLEKPVLITPPEEWHPNIGNVTAEIGLQQCKRIKKELGYLRKQWDEAHVHRLRIRGKRLRYLLEPFLDDAKVARAVAGMKKFQERLGDYRDQQLLLEHLATLSTNSENNSGDPATINTLVDSLQEKLKKQRKQAKQYRKRGKQKRLLKTLNSALRQLNK